MARARKDAQRAKQITEGLHDVAKKLGEAAVLLREVEHLFSQEEDSLTAMEGQKMVRNIEGAIYLASAEASRKSGDWLGYAINRERN